MTEERPPHTTVRWLAVGAGIAASSYATYVGVSWLRYGRATPSSGDDVDALLDQFMPAYDVMERHQTDVGAPNEVTFEAASEMDIRGPALVRALFQGRALLLGSRSEEVERPRGLLAWMQSLGWTVLAETPGRQVVLGNVMRPWEPTPTPRVVPPAKFAAFQEPGYVKIVSTWAAGPLGPSESRFTIGTRVASTDATARRRFRRYWAVFSPGSVLIRYLGLHLVRKEAEARAMNRLRTGGPGQDNRV